MKIRKGFVSNSSSSSFVVIDSSKKRIALQPKKKELLVVPLDFGGQTDFGREYADVRDFPSRLNFAAALAYGFDSYMQNNGYDPYEFQEKIWETIDPKNCGSLVEMLRKVVGDHFKCKIDFALVPDYYDEMENEDPLAVWNNEKEYILPCFDEDGEMPSKVKTARTFSVDHESAWCNRPENLLIFLDEDNLSDFLFGRGSYVALRCEGYNMDVDLQPGHWSTAQYSEDDDEEGGEDESTEETSCEHTMSLNLLEPGRPREAVAIDDFNMEIPNEWVVVRNKIEEKVRASLAKSIKEIDRLFKDRDWTRLHKYVAASLPISKAHNYYSIEQSMLNYYRQVIDLYFTVEEI
jgi:hypothetical protein